MLGKKLKSDWTYGWHASRTGVVMYYYHVDQGTKLKSAFNFLTTFGEESKIVNLNKERSERQTISLTSDMVMISTLELKRTTLLGQPQGLTFILS